MGLFDKLFGKKEETFDPNHILLLWLVRPCL